MAFISAELAGGEAVVRFLDLTSDSEGTSFHPLTKCDGYDVIVTGLYGGPEVFTDFSNHPFANGRKPKLFRMPDIPANRSTASGRYQILVKYWPDYQKQLGLKDFSPLSQDLYALQQMRERHAIPLILAGKIEDAITACSNIWASFPGNNYSQHAHPMEVLLQKYESLMANGVVL